MTLSKAADLVCASTVMYAVSACNVQYDATSNNANSKALVSPCTYRINTERGNIKIPLSL